MDTAAHLAVIAGVASLIAGVLISLFSRSPGGTRARNFFFCLVFLFVGVYRVAADLALRQKGLGMEFSRHPSIIRMSEHPIEAALSFWLSIFAGGAMSVFALLGAVIFALPTPDQDTADAQAEQNTDASENVAEEASP